MEEKGDRDRRREKGDRRQWRRQETETGDRRQDKGDRRIGDRRQETGGQESEDTTGSRRCERRSSRWCSRTFLSSLVINCGVESLQTGKCYLKDLRPKLCIQWLMYAEAYS